MVNSVLSHPAVSLDSLRAMDNLCFLSFIDSAAVDSSIFAEIEFADL